LPFRTKVLVTNVRNRRTAVVRITYRGHTVVAVLSTWALRRRANSIWPTAARQW